MKGTKFFGIGIALVVCVLALLLVGEAGFVSVAKGKPPFGTYLASLTFQGGSDKIRGDESQYYKDGEILLRSKKKLVEVVAKIYSGGTEPKFETILGKNEPLPPNFIRESGGRRVFLGLDANLVTDNTFKAALSDKLTTPQGAGKFVAHLSIRIYRDLLQMTVGETISTDATVHFMVDGLTQAYVQSLPGGAGRTFVLTNDGLHVMFYLDFGSGGFQVTRTGETTWKVVTVSGSVTAYVMETTSGQQRVDLSSDTLPFGFRKTAIESTRMF